jgi:pimeloyl-ACP methyl ester carboxylesterase
MDLVVSKDGTKIAYDRYGEGPTVVIVGAAFQHRALDPSMGMLGELLAPHFTVVVYDRRGRGDSGDTAPYAPEREIEDIEALIAETGAPAHLFGGSSGAVLALDAAAHGLPVATVAAYEPPLIVDDSRPPLPTNYVRHLNDLIADGRRGDAVEFFMTQAVGDSAGFVEQMKNSPMWPLFEGVAHTLAYDGAIVEDVTRGTPLPRFRWAEVTMPALVMNGSASYPFMAGAADALAAMLPNAERRTLEGQTHGADPEVLAPVLEGFFRR